MQTQPRARIRIRRPQMGIEFCHQKQVKGTKLPTTIRRALPSLPSVAACGYSRDRSERGLGGEPINRTKLGLLAERAKAQNAPPIGFTQFRSPQEPPVLAQK